MIRVFLDANVLFSAAISENGVCRAIFEVCVGRPDLTLVCTRFAGEEASFNLSRKYPEAVEKLPALMQSLVIADEPPESLVAQMSSFISDPDDQHILAGSIAARADILITGNSRDFSDLYGSRVRQTVVMRPRDALEFLISV